MGKDAIQIIAEEDGCVYVIDGDTKEIKKVCAITESREVPPSVQRVLGKFGIKAVIKGSPV